VVERLCAVVDQGGLLEARPAEGCSRKFWRRRWWRWWWWWRRWWWLVRRWFLLFAVYKGERSHGESGEGDRREGRERSRQDLLGSIAKGQRTESQRISEALLVALGPHPLLLLGLLPRQSLPQPLHGQLATQTQIQSLEQQQLRFIG